MDLRKLETKLLELFISREHNRINPLNVFNCTPQDVTSQEDEAVKMYRSNPMFAATVKYQVANVMHLVAEAEREGNITV